MLNNKFLESQKISCEQVDLLYPDDSSDSSDSLNDRSDGVWKMFAYGCIIVILINAPIWAYFIVTM